MQKYIWLLALCAGLTTAASAQTYAPETVVMETSLGTMKFRLFTETPLHRKNFLKLAGEGFFDSLLFHRVINGFMIQGGDPLSRKARAGDSLGHGDLGYMVPAEIKSRIFHVEGRLCAARESDDINPEMASSASQFYVVMGKIRTEEDLKKIAEKKNKSWQATCARRYAATPAGKTLSMQYERLKTEQKSDSAAFVAAKIEAAVAALYSARPETSFSAEQVKLYTGRPGTPHLDGAYTVFGEITEGREVIAKIASVQTDKRDRPLQDIRMKVYIINQ